MKSVSLSLVSEMADLLLENLWKCCCVLVCMMFAIVVVAGLASREPASRCSFGSLLERSGPSLLAG